MVKPVYATLFPTRRCNLKCSYCKIVDNTFPNELGFGNLLVGIEHLHQTLDLTIWVFLGGDVTIFGKEKLAYLTEFMNERDIFYAYTSNSMLIDEDWADRLVAAGLKNWSVSVDSLALEQHHRGMKASAGLRAIELFHERGVKDLHATVTLHKQNLEGTIDVVKWLSDHDTYAEITPIIFGKNEHYDFGHSRERMADLCFEESDVPKIEAMMETLIQMKEKGYLIHNLDAYLRSWKDYVVDQQWKCSNYWGIVIDADGALRPCIHLHGNKMRKYNVKYIKDYRWENIHKAFEADKAAQCQGCLWNCIWETEYIYHRTGDIGAVYQYFQHGAKAVERMMGDDEPEISNGLREGTGE